MSVVDEKRFEEVFQRLRQDEEKTSALAARLEAVVDKIDMTTQKFFDLELKRIESERVRIQAEDERMEAREKHWDARFDKLWKLVIYLVGTVTALALGPKAVDKMAESLGPRGKSQTTTKLTPYAIPPDDRGFHVISMEHSKI